MKEMAKEKKKGKREKRMIATEKLRRLAVAARACKSVAN